MLATDAFFVSPRACTDACFSVAGQAVEGAEKLARLQLQTVRKLIAEIGAAAQAALSAKEPQELLALQTLWLKPVPAEALAYGEHAFDVLVATGTDIGKTTQALAAEAQQKFLSAIGSAFANVPSGRAAVLALSGMGGGGAPEVVPSARAHGEIVSEVVDAVDHGVKPSRPAARSRRRAA